MTKEDFEKKAMEIANAIAKVHDGKKASVRDMVDTTLMGAIAILLDIAQQAGFTDESMMMYIAARTAHAYQEIKKQNENGSEKS